VLALLALVTAGCGGSSKGAASTTTATHFSVTTHGRYRYPPVLVDNFMRTCTSGSNAKAAYCSCTLDKLSGTVSTRDFARIGLSGGKVSQRIRRAITQAARACAGKL
jgi:hypothetical protein